MKFETIKISIKERIGYLTLNRPKVLNAINEKMIDEINFAMKELNSNDKIACIVVKGEGRCFSAGFDMKESGQRSINGKEQWMKVLKKDFDFIIQFWNNPKPTIAEVHGFCLAGAFELMLACDIALVEKATFLGQPEVRFGSGIVAMLAPWVTTPKYAKEILLTGNDRFTAKECKEMGIVNYVLSSKLLSKKVDQICKQISNASDKSVKLTKKAINLSYENANIVKSLDSALEIETEIESDESPVRIEFNRIRKEKGLKEAIEWRDKRFENKN